MLQGRGFFRLFTALMCVALFASFTGCGTLIHPERRGQTSGRIDPAIAVLDGIGLLFFLIPGLIAYAVDFSTGAIYLPSGSAKADPGEAEHTAKKPENWRVVYIDPDELTPERIEELLKEETGLNVRIEDARRVLPIEAGDDATFERMAKLNVAWSVRNEIKLSRHAHQEAPMLH